MQNQRFVRFSHAPIRSLAASQRRVSKILIKKAGVQSPLFFYLHTVNYFFRLSNQRFVRSAHAPIRSLAASQRRVSKILIKKAGVQSPLFFYLHTVNYFLTRSLNFLPAENAGTVFAEILIVAPV